MDEVLLTTCVVAIVVLAISLWDLNRRCQRAFQVSDATLAGLARVIEERRQTNEAELRAALDEQEKLIAMLWYKAYGMEPQDGGEYGWYSGLLKKVHGLRPRLIVGDPAHLDRDRDFYFRKPW